MYVGVANEIPFLLVLNWSLIKVVKTLFDYFFAFMYNIEIGVKYGKNRYTDRFYKNVIY